MALASFFLIALTVFAETPLPSPPPAFACTPETIANATKEFAAFVSKPTSEGAKLWTTRLCQIAPEGATPCPINITEDRVTDLVNAVEKLPNMISVVACAVPSADPGAAQELDDLQARTLDHLKLKFFTQWLAIPKQYKGVAQKFEDFGSLTPDSPENYSKRAKTLKERVELLSAAPLKMKEEIKSTLNFLKEEMVNSKKSNGTKEDGEINFKLSDFRNQIIEKIKKMPNYDPVRSTTLANEIILNEGLNFKVYMKTSNYNWNVCSASTVAADACHTTTVGFTKGQDACGVHALLGLLFESGQTWVMMSGSSSYRIDHKDLFTPVSVKLFRNGTILREWNMPNGFTPEFLNADLHNLYSRISLYTDAGEKLGDLHLLMHENGRFQFMELPKENLIPIKRKSMQDVKSLDGTISELRLPKCR